MWLRHSMKDRQHYISSTLKYFDDFLYCHKNIARIKQKHNVHKTIFCTRIVSHYLKGQSYFSTKSQFNDTFISLLNSIDKTFVYHT